MNRYTEECRLSMIRQVMRTYQIGEPGSHYANSESEGFKQDDAHIYIFGDIVMKRWFYEDITPDMVRAAVERIDGNDVFVHINSYGGATAAGLAIYNLLKFSGKNITTIDEGFACSAGSIVFMAGSKRIVREASLIMIHHAWTIALGNANELRKAANDLEIISNTAANAYRQGVNITEEKLIQLLDEETWIAPDKALEWGFATEISGEVYAKGTNSSANPQPRFNENIEPGSSAGDLDFPERDASESLDSESETEPKVKTNFERFFGKEQKTS